MIWSDFKNKTVGIWGMGKEGEAALKALQRYAPSAQIIPITEENKQDLQFCQILIKSPGVSLYRSEIQELKQKGIPILSGSSLFFQNKNPKTKVLAVTGTKGKSTTSSLLAHTLSEIGISVSLGGNIGVPLLDLLETPSDFVVAELSSYQCADLVGHPYIAVLLNLYPEHLQWHGTHEQYYHDKLNMIRHSHFPILNATDPLTKKFATDIQPSLFFNGDKGIHIKDNFFYDSDQALFPISHLNLRGRHNAENACAVLSVIKALDFSFTPCEKAFQTFQPLPHRLQPIGTYHSISFIDDSISTTPETVIAGLNALQNGHPITVLVGGFDRGQNYDALIRYIKESPITIRLITLPDTGSRIQQAAKKEGLFVEPANNMREAVQKAFQITPKEGTVLLSPGAPSYNAYRNFEERGADFKREVEALV